VPSMVQGSGYELDCVKGMVRRSHKSQQAQSNAYMFRRWRVFKHSDYLVSKVVPMGDQSDAGPVWSLSLSRDDLTSG
jgi:hypothetical protein